MQNVAQTIRSGTNVIAIHCNQKGGGQYIDAGLSQCVHVNAKTTIHHGGTPLCIAAAWNSNLEVLKYLVSRGADVNARNNDGATPLHYVAHHNPDNIEVFRYLVSQGADVNAKLHWGHTPLHDFAMRHGSNVEVLKYLVSKGAKVYAKNDWGDTPLHFAAKHNPNVEVLKYLVSQGAGVNAKNNGGWTPLHEAAAHNSNVEVLRYLVSVPGADVNVRNNWEGKTQTPLDLAETEEKKSILRAAGGRSGQ
jgi:ankyrin repeat protein